MEIIVEGDKFDFEEYNKWLIDMLRGMLRYEVVPNDICPWTFIRRGREFYHHILIHGGVPGSCINIRMNTACGYYRKVDYRGLQETCIADSRVVLGDLTIELIDPGSGVIVNQGALDTFEDDSLNTYVLASLAVRQTCRFPETIRVIKAAANDVTMPPHQRCNAMRLLKILSRIYSGID